VKEQIRGQAESDEAGYFEGYVSFARTLRTWLVAYGVGGPALVLTQETLASKFVASANAGLITELFLGGVGTQVLGALLYKTSMWYLYMGERHETLKGRRMYKIADWLSEAFWLESLLDLTSIVLLGWASYLLLSLFSASPQGM